MEEFRAIIAAFGAVIMVAGEMMLVRSKKKLLELTSNCMNGGAGANEWSAILDGFPFVWIRRNGKNLPVCVPAKRLKIGFLLLFDSNVEAAAYLTPVSSINVFARAYAPMFSLI